MVTGHKNIKHINNAKHVTRTPSTCIFEKTTAIYYHHEVIINRLVYEQHLPGVYHITSYFDLNMGDISIFLNKNRTTSSQNLRRIIISINYVLKIL